MQGWDLEKGPRMKTAREGHCSTPSSSALRHQASTTFPGCSLPTEKKQRPRPPRLKRVHVQHQVRWGRTGGERRKPSSRFEKAVCVCTVHVKGSVCPDKYNRQFLCCQKAVAPPTPTPWEGLLGLGTLLCCGQVRTKLNCLQPPADEPPVFQVA